MIFELNLDGQKILIEGTNEIRSLIKRRNELNRSIDNLTYLMDSSKQESYKIIEKLGENIGSKIDEACREYVIVISRLRDIVYDN